VECNFATRPPQHIFCITCMPGMPLLVHVLKTMYPLPLCACSLVHNYRYCCVLLYPQTRTGTRTPKLQKRHCTAHRPMFLSRPLVLDPLTNPSRAQTPRPNVDLFAVRSALIAAVLTPASVNLSLGSCLVGDAPISRHAFVSFASHSPWSKTEAQRCY
jgi:hypothetical protein